MKLNAVAVSTHDIEKAVAFYTLLGFTFPEFKPNDMHVEAEPQAGSLRLMIDSAEMMKNIMGEEPRPGNYSGFALQYDSPAEVNAIAKKLEQVGHTIVKQPWDAVWGQRYAIVADPSGYKIDLYAQL